MYVGVGVCACGSVSVCMWECAHKYPRVYERERKKVSVC